MARKCNKLLGPCLKLNVEPLIFLKTSIKSVIVISYKKSVNYSLVISTKFMILSYMDVITHLKKSVLVQKIHICC